MEVLPKNAVESIHTEKRQEDLIPWIAIIAEPSVLCGLESDNTCLKKAVDDIESGKVILTEHELIEE